VVSEHSGTLLRTTDNVYSFALFVLILPCLLASKVGAVLLYTCGATAPVMKCGVTSAESLATFRCLLETYLFRKSVWPHTGHQLTVSGGRSPVGGP